MDEEQTVPAPALVGLPIGDAHALAGSLLDERALAAGLHLEVGRLDGEAVSVGARHVVHGLVVLTLGATLPHAPHRGCWAAVVRSRLALARRRGRVVDDAVGAPG